MRKVLEGQQREKISLGAKSLENCEETAKERVREKEREREREREREEGRPKVTRKLVHWLDMANLLIFSILS